MSVDCASRVVVGQSLTTRPRRNELTTDNARRSAQSESDRDLRRVAPHLGLCGLDHQLWHEQREAHSDGVAIQTALVGQRFEHRWRVEADKHIAPRVDAHAADGGVRRNRTEAFAEEDLGAVGLLAEDIDAAEPRIREAQGQLRLQDAAAQKRRIEGAAPGLDAAVGDLRVRSRDRAEAEPFRYH